MSDALLSNPLLPARRDEGDGCQLVEVAVNGRALSTRSCTGQTHVGAASPQRADQLHDEAAGGRCAVCEHEVPWSEAPVREASDYMAHFCGLECYARWRKLAEVLVSSIR